MGPGILVGTSGGGVFVSLVVLVNSSIDLGFELGKVGAGAGLIVAVKVGSATLLPFLFPYLALHSKSCRFCGCRRPKSVFCGIESNRVE